LCSVAEEEEEEEEAFKHSEVRGKNTRRSMYN
jgi:hypothetical protein